MLKSFVPLFVMTFFICLFIVMMQFLWRFIDDFVGKGLSIGVIGELFFYASLTMIPMALPLAILLASLMTFGNLGERFELTAMKASGVSLIKTMKPLIALVAFIAIAAFFFQNNVLPVAQTKMWTLLYSMRQKSPELEIPEGVFYDQIPGYNIYVKEKNRDNGTLYQMMIYDLSKGFDNASVILADSGRLVMTEDKTHLVLRLWQGESFENLKEAGMSSANVPYRRESFAYKEVLLKFDANFNRMDEDGMRNQYVGKNIAELQETIDSVRAQADSIGSEYAKAVQSAGLMSMPLTKGNDTTGRSQEAARRLNVDSVFRGSTSAYTLSYLQTALEKTKRQRQDYEFKGYALADKRKTIRRHGIELQKKFTLSFACLVFFFIGAPLGAIIRKGGLGMPLVISVFLFIFYYIIDNTGNKMAREGRLEVWEGMWLSAAVLLPLGVFFTYKAVNDSAVFNRDAYVNFFRRLLGRGEVRSVSMKEVIMEEVVKSDALTMLESLSLHAGLLRQNLARCKNYVAYWTQGVPRQDLKALSAELESTVEYLANSRDRLVVMKLMDFPVLRSLWIYHPTGVKWVAWSAIILFPIGLPVYIAGRRSIKHLDGEIATIEKVSREEIKLLNGEKPQRSITEDNTQYS